MKTDELVPSQRQLPNPRKGDTSARRPSYARRSHDSGKGPNASEECILSPGECHVMQLVIGLEHRREVDPFLDGLHGSGEAWRRCRRLCQGLAMMAESQVGPGERPWVFEELGARIHAVSLDDASKADATLSWLHQFKAYLSRRCRQLDETLRHCGRALESEPSGT